MNHLTRNDIIDGLRQLQISKGDTIIVHSSLSSFGWVEGGAETVVSALLTVIGEEGTLVMPTFSKYLQNGETVWDRENTPSLMGKITEVFRTWPGTLRSSHAAHPLAANGRQARMICDKPYKTGFGPDSPFKTLLQLDASILLMGVSYDRCTFFHLLEVEANVPYRYLEARKAKITINGQTSQGCAWEYTRKEGARNEFLPLGEKLESEGLVQIKNIGDSTLRCFKAKDAYQIGMRELAENPFFLLAK